MMFFKNKWKERAYEMLEEYDKLKEENNEFRKRNLNLAEELDKQKNSYVTIKHLNVSKRILDLRLEALEDNKEPKVLYIPYGIWSIFLERINTTGLVPVKTDDIDMVFGMKAVLTSKEMRVE